MWSSSFAPVAEDAQTPRSVTPPHPGTSSSSTKPERESPTVSQTLIIEGTISANELAALLMTHGHRCRVVDPLTHLSQRPNDQNGKYSNRSMIIATMSSCLTDLLALEDTVEEQREQLRDMEKAKSLAIESAHNCEKQSKASYDSYIMAQKKFDKQLGDQKKLLLEVIQFSLSHSLRIIHRTTTYNTRHLLITNPLTSNHNTHKSKHKKGFMGSLSRFACFEGNTCVRDYW